MPNWYRNIVTIMENSNPIKEDWSQFDIKLPEFDPDDGVLVLGTEIVDATLISAMEPLDEKEGIEYLAEQILKNKIFVRIEVNDNYEILDGHHRYLAITQVLGWKHIPVVIIEFGHYDDE